MNLSLFWKTEDEYGREDGLFYSLTDIDDSVLDSGYVNDLLQDVNVDHQGIKNIAFELALHLDIILKEENVKVENYTTLNCEVVRGSYRLIDGVYVDTGTISMENITTNDIPEMNHKSTEADITFLSEFYADYFELLSLVDFLKESIEATNRIDETEHTQNDAYQLQSVRQQVYSKAIRLKVERRKAKAI